MRNIPVICILAALMVVAISPVSAGGYRDYNPTLELESVKDTGFAFFIVQGIPKVDSPSINIVPGNLTMDNVSYEDMNFYANLNMTALPKVEILPDGTTVPIKLDAGFYTAYMITGYAEPEIRSFRVGGGMYEISGMVWWAWCSFGSSVPYVTARHGGYAL